MVQWFSPLKRNKHYIETLFEVTIMKNTILTARYLNSGLIWKYLNGWFEKFASKQLYKESCAYRKRVEEKEEEPFAGGLLPAGFLIRFHLRAAATSRGTSDET